MAVGWIAWAIIMLISFAFIEAYAINHPSRQWTLSHSMAWLGEKWPLTIFFFGLFTGGLAVHFFWHFCP